MYINDSIDYIKYLKNKKIIIFGAGGLGKRIGHLLKINKLKVCYYCDNDNNKLNKKFDGVDVIDFEQLKLIDSKEYFVIIASMFKKEISEQLMEASIFNFVNCDEIDFSGVNNEEFYDETYFNWQKVIGDYEVRNKIMWLKKIITNDDRIIDFGSGGGQLLNALNNSNSIGIEVNDLAREFSKNVGVNTVKYIDEVEDNFADVITAFHVLGHLENPLDTLKKLRKKLKKKGKFIAEVPYVKQEYRRNDINNILFSWNELTLGNLFK